MLKYGRLILARTSRESRKFSTCPTLRKKVSKHTLSELVESQPKPEIHAKLDRAGVSTGSIVLDTVRHYTKKYPLCVLLVQVGDFYELYESHARQYASQLDLKLTKKMITSNNTVDFAGFPSRSLDRYLDILVNRLQCKVALCEQLGAVSQEDKTVVGMDRRVTRIITPGTVIEERFLASNQYNYLLSIYPKDGKIGLAWVDISVGEFIMQETNLTSLKDDLARIRPREVILPDSMRLKNPALDEESVCQETYDPVTKLLINDSNIVVSYMPDQQYDAQLAGRTFNELFNQITHTLEFSQYELAAGMALVMYVNETHLDRKPKWQKPIRFDIQDSVCIDSAAMNSLELVTNLQGKRADSLLGSIDCTSTSAGSRLLTRWVSSPPTSIEEIKKRQDIVSFFVDDSFLLDDIRLLLRQSTDAQRALQRLALKRGQHSDILEIYYTLDIMKRIHERLCNFTEVTELLEQINPHHHIASKIKDTLNFEKVEAKEVKNWGYIRYESHPELARLHTELQSLDDERLQLQDNLRSLCGNSVSLHTEGSLKHVIEVNARQASQLLMRFPNAIPLNQTKSKKRFQVQEWMDISVRLEDIQSQIGDLEKKIFEEMVESVLDDSTTILRSCRKLAELDVLSSFAYAANKYNYVRPRLMKSSRTLIKGGRHPVVEINLAKKGRSFVNNNCDVGGDQKIWLLTGPNMGGKSTFIRQHAIIVLMAHMGCFVPADSAWIGITDKIFSRVGAADNLAQNQSTFMVEMSEVSTILQQATSKSTVIMDEVGRGTSTKDGFSIAFGILDHLHNKIKCRTLFATHYHELADVTKDYKHMKCFHTRIEENPQGGFRFIHKVEPGVCRQSHGLKVAKIAGLPSTVIDKAAAMRQQLDTEQQSSNGVFLLNAKNSHL
ncbi:DNA mismatch repair protein MutS [Mycotypha africana]|uniref:DNA mismatch repair protein MutS n=1 Tax=Mycotypha africana TaxID=64632 RepID=UPI00230006D9|nr:DNA mismatch repair protein MutS [Mycotypha africana]KAI8987883.1 DNA mismatch repair protein MutS [Mycotypha africana]